MIANLPALVAHRGYPGQYPENTLEGVRAALQAGARYIEIDVQLSRDKVPLLMHDEDLVRTAGVDVCVFDLTCSELQKYSVSISNRFGSKYAGIRIATLGKLVELLQQWPEVQVFVELKRASLDRFGRRVVLDAVCQTLEPLADRSIIISFDSRVIRQAQQRGRWRTGWAIRAMHKRHYEHALRMAPTFLFFSTRILPAAPQPLWPGPWQYVVYTVNDPLQVIQLAQRGIHFIETDMIGEMLVDPGLQRENIR